MNHPQHHGPEGEEDNVDNLLCGARDTGDEIREMAG